MKKRILCVFLVMSIMLGNIDIIVYAKEGQEITEEGIERNQEEIRTEVFNNMLEEDEDNAETMMIDEKEKVLESEVEPKDIEDNSQEAEVSGKCGDNLTWKIEDGVLTISGTGDMWNWNYSENGNSAPWGESQYFDTVELLVIENGVESIGNSAFANCSSFRGELTIPESVTVIGGYAFRGCSGFTGDLTIPEGVTGIGGYAFCDCSGFTGDLAIPGSVKVVERYAFRGCSGFTGRLKILEGVETIQTNAFSNCSGFTGELTIPESMRGIDSYAFRDCSGFTGGLTISENVTRIGDEAFRGCGGFTGELRILGNVTWIDNHAFTDSGFTSVIFEGDAPKYVIVNAFANVTAKVFYPSWKSGWDNVANNNYEGTLTWIPYSEGTQPWLLENTDRSIIEAVERYTSGEEVKEVLDIINSSYSDEKKRQMLFEYYNYDNMLDVKERLVTLSDMHDERWDYEGLIRDDIYLSWQYYYYLNHTSQGAIARTALYLSGLAFNNELSEWVDPSTYLDGDYPGIKKYKSLLEEFIHIQNEKNEYYTYIKETEKFINSSVGIWSKVEKGDVIKSLKKAPDAKSCHTLFNNFIAVKTEAFEGKPVVFDGEKPKFMKAMAGTDEIFEIVNLTADRIGDIMQISTNLELYETYHKFLWDIYKSDDLPWELVVAAYQLDKELAMAYWTPVENILNSLRDMCLGEVFDVAKMLGVKEYLAAISFTAFCINQFVDIGKMVRNSCHTEGYAFLAMHYKSKLEKCKTAFLADKSEENAWAFYEAYEMLRALRIAGEDKFLKMSMLEGSTVVDNLYEITQGDTMAELISLVCGYEDKKAAIDDNLALLKSFGFKYYSEDLPDHLKYLQKVIVECPVNVEFLTEDGILMCALSDNEEMAVSNEYGEFVSFYRATTGDYVKIAYLNGMNSLKIKATGTEPGKVSYTFSETQDHDTYTLKGFNDVLTEPGSIISVDVKQDKYEIDKNADGKVDIEGWQADKKRLFVQFDYQDNALIKVVYADQNGYIMLPDMEEVNGKLFLGWYTEPEGKGEEFTGNIPIQESITVYAGWEEQTISPSAVPTETPAVSPTEVPAVLPTVSPSIFPTAKPTIPPSVTPTTAPTSKPVGLWPFIDVAVKEGNWKYENIKFAYEKGVMTGVKADEFQPDAPLTRAQFASVIYRMAGSPEVTYQNIFTDVHAGKWYSDAILWAYENKIVAGLGDGRYGINDNITREQMARMLMEFAGTQGYDISAREDFGKFADADQVSKWALENMRWAVGSGIISGSTKGGKYYMNPKGQATRAECAVMLTKFIRSCK